MSEMYWAVLFCLLLMETSSKDASFDLNTKLFKQYVEQQKDRFDKELIVIPQEPEDLPEAKAISPGHSLLQPSDHSLKSAIKFPQEEDQMLVYGNLDNVGITYDKTKARVLFTSFRRENDLLDMLLKPTVNRKSRKPILVYIRGNPFNRHKKSEHQEKVSEEENDASEILDNEELFGGINDQTRVSRRTDTAHKYRERESKETYESDPKSSSGSSDYEKNPGNPYTIYKNKYLQNWMWNHYMDGDHMNINPYAPPFNSLGPSGAALFFNRKWWYYNQDDFKPFD